MKSLSTYLTESKAWYVPFVELFQKNINKIIKDIDYRDDFNDPKVVKTGSSKSPVFEIRFKNDSGVPTSVEFMITPEPWQPNFKKVPFLNSGYASMLNSVEKLIKKNIDKLPKLQFDSLGNIDMDEN